MLEDHQQGLTSGFWDEGTEAAGFESGPKAFHGGVVVTVASLMKAAAPRDFPVAPGNRHRYGGNSDPNGERALEMGDAGHADESTFLAWDIAQPGRIVSATFSSKTALREPGKRGVLLTAQVNSERMEKVQHRTANAGTPNPGPLRYILPLHCRNLRTFLRT